MVGRHLDDDFTLEINRLATNGTPNACSAFYGASWRVAREMGYERLLKYILATKPGQPEGGGVDLRRRGGWWVVVGAEPPKGG